MEWKSNVQHYRSYLDPQFPHSQKKICYLALLLVVTTHQAYLESMTWSVKRLLLASIWTAGLTLTRYFVQMEGARPNDPVRHSIVLDDVWKGYFWLDYCCLSLVWASDWKVKNIMHIFKVGLENHLLWKTNELYNFQYKSQWLKFSKIYLSIFNEMFPNIFHIFQ